MPRFSWNSRCLLRDGVPFFPMMGEIHYSRCSASSWPLELAKMKAGGVDIAATYAFWIHHEAEEGRFRFDGQRSLRRFVQCCAEAGLYVWLRIGPWCHGEVRNGGFPDWLLKKTWRQRANDPDYLAAVERYWRELARQTEGLWVEQGGPIIGLQLENEYGHCGGAGDPAHMDALLALSRRLGMRPAYVSATGWGGAVLGTGQEILPVMSAYCDAPWDHRRGPLPANPNYLFSEERNDTDVGSDFRKGEHLYFDPSLYPFLTAELGGGMQGVWHRRPFLIPADTAAMSLCKLGSGAAMLGYYMYHGGTNPDYGLQESPSSGGYCELPVLSYDYRCPIREFGQITDTLLELKLFGMFFRAYGNRLAVTEAFIPADSPRDPEDLRSPRWSWRSDGHSGFLFVCNHQRRRHMTDKTLTLTIPTDDGPRVFRDLRMPGGSFGFFPFNFTLGKTVLRTANATPLCCLNGQTYVFYTDETPLYDLSGPAEILTLSRQEALHSWKIASGGREGLVVSSAPLVQFEGKYLFLAREAVQYTCYWSADQVESGTFAIPASPARVTRGESREDTQGVLRVPLSITDDPRADELLLSIRYEGSKAELWRGETLLADDFADGHAFQVSLRRLGMEDLTLRVYPLHEGEEIYLDRPPVFEDGVACRLLSVSAVSEYHLPCPWPAD